MESRFLFKRLSYVFIKKSEACKKDIIHLYHRSQVPETSFLLHGSSSPCNEGCDCRKQEAGHNTAGSCSSSLILVSNKINIQFQCEDLSTINYSLLIKQSASVTCAMLRNDRVIVQIIFIWNYFKLKGLRHMYLIDKS